MAHRIERLDPDRHDRSGFECGEQALDAYLRHQARQDERRSLTSVFCLIEEGAREVLGYYAVSTYGVYLRDVPEALGRRLASYPVVPAFLLGRLAVDAAHQGRGFGAMLLVNAIRRCAASEIKGWAVLVEATNDRALEFYRRFGFEELPGSPNRLLLPMSTIRKAM